MADTYRTEKDALGSLQVPQTAYWGISTERAIQNFRISSKRFPRTLIYSLAEVKKACLQANLKLALIDDKIGSAIAAAVDEMLNAGKYYDQFPLDVYQTGSGTQLNMNMNEVLANRANESLGFPMGRKEPVHPNDHVNRCQSSNDVIPTSMHVATLHMLAETLSPALLLLQETLSNKISEFDGVVKIGRTHLQDAVPINLSTEFEVYRQQVSTARFRLEHVCNELCFIPLGGTAVGTGIGAEETFAELAVEDLARISGFPLRGNPVKAEGIASHNALVHTSAVLKELALAVMKMANDIRWMASGPRAGLGELIIPANEPGSSIMPGKINPTQSEALIQVAVQVLGNDAAITAAESHGSILDLNVCKPVMIYNLLDSIDILSNAITSFAQKCLNGITVNTKKVESDLERSLMIVTNLSPILGYDTCALIAQKAHEEGKTIYEVVNEMELTLNDDLERVLDPKRMVKKRQTE